MTDRTKGDGIAAAAAWLAAIIVIPAIIGMLSSWPMWRSLVDEADHNQRASEAIEAMRLD